MRRVPVHLAAAATAIQHPFGMQQTTAPIQRP